MQAYSATFSRLVTLLLALGLPTLALALAPQPVEAAVNAAPASGMRPGVGARPGGVRPGVRGPHAGTRGIHNNPRTIDTRSQIVEGSLRDRNRSLETSRPGPVNLPRPADCPGCPTRADLNLEASPGESDRALRGSLHRLRRETRIAQNPDEQRNQAETVVSERP